MVHDGEAKHVCVFGGAAHDFVILDAVAVVGDGDNAGVFEGTDGGEFFAFAADGDGAGGEDVDDAGAFCGFFDEFDGAGVVGRGRGVGHADEGGDASCCCG